MERQKEKVWHRSAIVFLTILIIVLCLGIYLLWREKGSAEMISEVATSTLPQEGSRVAVAEAGFTDSNEFVLPIKERFENTVAKHIAQEESFIEVDLKEMQVMLYENGKLLKSYPVMSKGRDGSWWETPTGNYKILTKEENHFSSIGKVWMPWSMQFYGNFFIHGWPYHEDGTPVSSTYSGGCVRLNTEDAQEIYKFAVKGMPVLLRDEEDVTKFGRPQHGADYVAPPEITARAFLVSNLATGEPILEKNADVIAPIASLTKIMTGIVASELVYLGKPIPVSKNMLAGTYAQFSPTIGEQYVAYDLLYPLLMQSSNEAANILAGFIGKEQFVGNMNKKATALSMNETTFADASGELAGNISSPKDIEKLLRYTYFKRKFIFGITKGEQDYRFSGRKLDNLTNFNEFVDQPSLVGIKNGETTAAKQTLAGVWEFKGEGGVIPVSIVVLGSDDRQKDTEMLLAWLKQNYNL